MHRDLKLGLALAVLLVGATTAFFFRADTEAGAGLPQLQDPERLDIEIASRDVAPYLGSPEADVGDPGEKTDLESPWAKPAFLGGSRPPIRRTSVTPDPIRIVIGDAEEAAEPGPEFPPAPMAEAESGGETSAEIAVPAGGRRTHIVRAGDTLSGLAATYLGSVARFEEIYALNRDRLNGPNDLRVGLELRIPDGSGPPAGETLEPSAGPLPAVPEPEDITAANDINTVPAPTEPSGDLAADRRDHPGAGDGEGLQEPAGPERPSGKLFVPVRKTPFVPGRFRSSAAPSVEAQPEAEGE